MSDPLIDGRFPGLASSLHFSSPISTSSSPMRWISQQIDRAGDGLRDDFQRVARIHDVYRYAMTSVSETSGLDWQERHFALERSTNYGVLEQWIPATHARPCLGHDILSVDEGW